ncbi:MAG: hypothetical protein K0M73_04030 [Hydrogenophaga sp.]|nr:hypothetical protein [Hydrogenophaga sp.]
MWVLGDRELTGGRAQGVTVPGRHGEPTLGIETERGSTLEHRDQPLENTFHHLIALFSTLSGIQTHASRRLKNFSNKIKHLEHILKHLLLKNAAKASTYERLCM